MSGTQEARPVLGRAGNAQNPTPKPSRKLYKSSSEKKPQDFCTNPRPLLTSRSVPLALRRQDLLSSSNLSLNASCSSDASDDSFCSRASTGRIGNGRIVHRRRQSNVCGMEKIVGKLQKVVLDGGSKTDALVEGGQWRRRCGWVTANTDPCYVGFHDEEWGVPVHDDKKLFELLVLSGALAELTWPVILSKRHIFREVFMDFDPVLVSKLNEKKIVVPGNTASSLLSEPKLRAIIENARQILKVIEEFGSFHQYCWSFVNHKPIVSRFQYPRQVPVKIPKADVISKDLVRRGFRSVGPTIIYSFMQATGITNDHLISCFRFEECVAAASVASVDYGADIKAVGNHKAERSINVDEGVVVEMDLSGAMDEMSVL